MKRILSLLLSLGLCLGLFAGGVPQTAAAEEPSAVQATDSTDYSTGSPWINSNIFSNVENSSETSLKDDFALAVDAKWVKNNPLKSGESCISYLYSFEGELNNRLYEILGDNTYTDDHNALLVQTYYNAFLDWDARDAAGVKLCP